MTKHFHHKPAFGGDLTVAVNKGASANGHATVTVLNGPHDSHFNPGTYKTPHGSVVTDASGSYTYTPDPTDAAVSALAAGATLTDTFTLPTVYVYRGIAGATIVATVTGV